MRRSPRLESTRAVHEADDEDAAPPGRGETAGAGGVAARRADGLAAIGGVERSAPRIELVKKLPVETASAPRPMRGSAASSAGLGPPSAGPLTGLSGGDCEGVRPPRCARLVCRARW